MPTLHEVQAGFAAALLHGDTFAETWIECDGVDAATRIGVHRNTVLLSLIDVLAAIFPMVQRLVDARFFAYAASEFVCAQPPHRPSLAEYGADFPDFLATFRPCRELAYLPDVARLEWAMDGLARAVARPALAPQALGSFSNDEAGRLVFEFQPTIALMASQFPVDAIWRANRTEAGEGVDLAAGPAHIEARKHADGIVLRRLDAATFAFRAELAGGRTLHDAADAALVCEPEFDLGRALADLFRDGAVTAVEPKNGKESRP